MRTLVTGGAGFIGSNLVDALVARGDAVTVVDDLSSGKQANLADALVKGARLEQADIRDAVRIEAVVAAARPELVFHLAAQADVRRSIEDPAFDASVNVLGTITVLEAARRAGAKRFVNTSTGGAIYGELGEIPTSETSPALPAAAYGQSKFCAEQYCAWANRLYGFETVTLRYGNVYGPRQNPQADAGVVAIFCGLVVNGGRPKIFGDGTQTRDYIFVDDVVAANLLAAEHPDASGVYNIGTEVESTVLDLATVLKASMEPDAAAAFEPTFEPARLGELQRSALDAGRARRELGFRAQTSLTDGIDVTLASVAALAA